MWRRTFAWIGKHERHLSAGAMVLGFAIDNIFFQRIDLLRTQAVLLSYLGIAAFAILILHLIEERADRGIVRPRFRALFSIAIQFALGGLWSAFLIFYSRSASLSASWPFLLILGGIFLGNEIFRKYHGRLVFNTILFFFALFSYTIFAVPLATHTIGDRIFVESGAAALILFAFFYLLLLAVGRARLLSAARPILVGVALIFVALNAFYFGNVLPPLPLALKDIGVYHAISRVDGRYHVIAEREPWYVSLGMTPLVHVVPGESLYVYSAVFAPVALSATIIHRWEWYDPAKKEWVTKEAVSFPIEGGRDGGYRGYSAKASPVPGQWRVAVETADGRLIGRVRFDVAAVALPPSEDALVLP